MAAINISGQTIVIVTRDNDTPADKPECLVRVFSVAGPKDNGIKLPAKVRVYRMFIPQQAFTFCNLLLES
jgi:hypothetical protein